MNELAEKIAKKLEDGDWYEHSHVVEDIQSVLAAEIPKLPEGVKPPFDIADDIHHNVWLTAGGDYILSFENGAYDVAKSFCALLNDLWKMQGGNDAK